jgi:CyaY protein
LNRALDTVVDQHDIETLFQNGVLSITVDQPTPSKIVISPQSATRQVWISAQSTSFKLDWSGTDFVLPSSGETLNQLVGRFIGESLGLGPITI